jgi:DNA repair exonuclease SbcCD ATPase subunit
MRKKEMEITYKRRHKQLYKFSYLDNKEKIDKHIRYINRIKKYNLTDSEFMAMLSGQSGRCKICGIKQLKKLCIDHNHTTGKVRGLLCKKCKGD